jgi:UDP-N-acetylglucosamine--N-acetylmuramyl-(pentapeptide) pyrophosphoryl-undecaprenol N-acetylglucosamine transferase
MRFIVTGGGTGGHIYPAIAVASEIRKREPGSEILFVGTKRGIESTAVPAAGFPIRHIHAAGFSANPLKLLKFAAFNSVGFIQAFSILREFCPGLVIGSGGYVSAPVIFAAGALDIPYVLLEQNVFPGKVNRLMAKKAKKVLVSFEDSVKYFPPGKAVVTGNPIRPEITGRKREDALRILGLSADRFTVMIVGASQGARSINNAVIKSLPAWKNNDWQILHLTGRKNFDEVKKATDEIIGRIGVPPVHDSKEQRLDYRCLDYSEDMPSIYAVTDLAVARAGASTLAEITARGIPSILVPLPTAAEDHQTKNAGWIEEVGGAVVLRDDEVGEKLADVVISLAAEKVKLSEMSRKSLTLARPEALNLIFTNLFD